MFNVAGQMQTGQWKFTPGIWPSLVTFLVLPILVSLGFWQLDRAEQKRELYQQFINQQSAAMIDLNRNSTILDKESEVLWRHIKLTGQFENQPHILLDNQVMKREPGYFVFTPLKLTNEDTWLLVNRGWVSAGTDRNVVPEIDLPAEEVELIAVATDVPVTGILLGNINIEKLDDKMYRAQRIDIEEISDLAGLKLLPFIARLEPESGHGFVREWIMPGSGEEKHLGYAFQWFALSLTLLIIFIVVNTRRIKTGDD